MDLPYYASVMRTELSFSRIFLSVKIIILVHPQTPVLQIPFLPHTSSVARVSLSGFITKCYYCPSDCPNLSDCKQEFVQASIILRTM